MDPNQNQGQSGQGQPNSGGVSDPTANQAQTGGDMQQQQKEPQGQSPLSQIPGTPGQQPEASNPSAVPDQGSQGQQPMPKDNGGGSKKKVLLIILILLFVVLLGLVVYFVFMSGQGSQEELAPQPVTSAPTVTPSQQMSDEETLQSMDIGSVEEDLAEIEEELENL